MLAGISAEYYLRMELGLDKNPSDQVLDALARVLRQYLLLYHAEPGSQSARALEELRFLSD